MNKVTNKYGGSFCWKSIAATISSYAQQVCQSRIQRRRPKTSFMPNRLTWISVFAVLMASLLNAGNASAQAITTRSTAGTYSVICDGYLTFPNPFPPTSNPPLFPICTGEVARDGHCRFRRSHYRHFAVERRRFCGRNTDGVWNGGIESERHRHHHLCHDDRWQSGSSPLSYRNMATESMDSPPTRARFLLAYCDAFPNMRNRRACWNPHLRYTMFRRGKLSRPIQPPRRLCSWR